ncbi:MAG: CHY zinc finger protein [Halolamina sp.]
MTGDGDDPDCAGNADAVVVGESVVSGVDVGPETRCAHWADDRDVIALRGGCCGRFYPCHACHEAVADHTHEPWPRERLDEPAVLCGVCATALTARAYLMAGFACPECGAAFNPGCRAHYDRYFEGWREVVES